ncbi:MAG: adenylate/guanylate cyclase domain-containing protein [Acidiferrobacterales bacterium]
MSDGVTEWLEELGLGQFAAVFAEQQIDHEVLSELTDEDLEKLGIPLGPRKKLLRAIGELQSGRATLLPETLPPTATPDRSHAERRQLTVMFCDLVGSTVLSERFDPEDLREIVGAFQVACAEVIGRYEGYIARYMGDGLLVYFGYPQAHEDDTERAVRAGLEIVQAVGAVRPRDDVVLQVRVGVATGGVVVGDVVGEGASQERAVLGETPNLAARLQGLAEPDSVLISAASQRLVEGLFECDDLGPQHLKGVSEEVRIFRVCGESGAPSRFEVSARRGLTPLVGREEEVGLLMKRWQQTVDGEGQVVLLYGEAGLGKSRISRGLRDRLEGVAHNRILYYSSPYHKNSALHPAINQLERALRFDKSDDAERKLEKLEATLAGLSVSVGEPASLLGSMLSLPVEGRYPRIEGSPQLLRRKTLEALVQVIEAMAVQAPVLMLVEDAHWIDRSTLEMLELLIERLDTTRVLLLITHRPGFEPLGGGHANVTALRLSRLSRKESALMVARVARDRTLPDEMVTQIVDRTDGVPLFVEELTKVVLESGLLKERGDGYTLTGPLKPVAIPASVQDSLMARLDRLGPVKEVAQLAAVLGRTFNRGLLATVSPLGEAELDDALSRLVEAELIYRRSVAPEISFEFKHALVQDTAYQSLLKKTRQRHHARIARVLEEEFPETAESEPELLARHYTEAGLAEPAIDHWHGAGRRAMQRSANIEAEEHLRKGLQVLDSLPETPERRQREIALLNTLGVCLMPTRGFGDPEVAGAFSRAATISDEEGDARGLFVALRGMGQYQMISGDLHTAREQAGRILNLAENLDDPGILIEAHHLGWSSLTFTGDFAAARNHAETAIGLYDRERDHHLTYVYSGHDPGVCCRSFGSLALWQLGYPDQAFAVCQDGETLAKELSHPFSVTVALWATGMLHLLRGETSATLETGESMISHCNEKGIPPFVPLGKIFRGGALAEEGEFAQGVAELREGISGMRALSTEYTLPLFVAWLADLCTAGGRVDEGLSAIEEGLAMCEKSADRFSLPEFHRVKGKLLLTRSARNKAEAEACFKQAMGIACAQEAKSLELRASLSLAQLWGENRKHAEARDLLALVYDWFTEGFDTADLKDAKTLLEQLS